MGKELATDEYRLAFATLAALHLLPVVWYWGLGARARAAALVYWVDAVALVGAYSVCALFAQEWSDAEIEEKTAVLKPTGVSFFSERPRRISDAVPPVYPRNLAVVWPTAAFLLFGLFAAGAQAFFGERSGARSAGDGGAFLESLGVLATPQGLAIVGVVIIVHAFINHRMSVRGGSDTEQTAYTVMEKLTRYWLALLALLFVFPWYYVLVLVFAEFVASTIVPAVSASNIATIITVVSFIALKLGLERARLRAEYEDEPGGLASWLQPSPLPKKAD